VQIVGPKSIYAKETTNRCVDIMTSKETKQRISEHVWHESHDVIEMKQTNWSCM